MTVTPRLSKMPGRQRDRADRRRCRLRRIRSALAPRITKTWSRPGHRPPSRPRARLEIVVGEPRVVFAQPPEVPELAADLAVALRAGGCRQNTNTGSPSGALPPSRRRRRRRCASATDPGRRRHESRSGVRGRRPASASSASTSWRRGRASGARAGRAERTSTASATSGASIQASLTHPRQHDAEREEQQPAGDQAGRPVVNRRESARRPRRRRARSRSPNRIA